MTERELQLLGFKKYHEYGTLCEDSTGKRWAEGEFYYYSYEVAKGFQFISSTSDEIKDGQWFVEFLDSDPAIRFIEFGEMQALINTLTSKIVTRES